MHVNYGFWGALLGIATFGAYQEDRYSRGKALASELLLAAGNDDLPRFYRALGPHMHKLRYGADAETWTAAVECAQELQSWKDGQIGSAPSVQRFREWCVGLI